MNIVCLIGNLVRDPETRKREGADTICAFTIAVNRWNDSADFPKIKVFGKTAENCDRYLSKGRKVAIIGKLRTDSYEKDGKKVYTTEVIADRVEFLSNTKSEVAERRSGQNVMAENFEQLNEDIPF